MNMANPQVELHITGHGVITLELDAEKAPKSTANFLAYVNSGFYNGTVFHRVIPNFMIQGGGMDASMNEKPTRSPIALESRNGLSNVRGSIAMARTMIPDSATAQFFINVKDNPFLDQPNSPDRHGYAVFGKVVTGIGADAHPWIGVGVGLCRCRDEQQGAAQQGEHGEQSGDHGVIGPVWLWLRPIPSGACAAGSGAAAAA